MWVGNYVLKLQKPVIEDDDGDVYGSMMKICGKLNFQSVTEMNW